MQVNDREGWGQPRVTKSQVFELIFSNKTCVSEPVSSQDSKNVIFVSVRCLQMLQITVWKNEAINGYGFCAIYLPEIDISTLNLAFYMPWHGSYCTFILHILYVFENFDFFGILKKLNNFFRFFFNGENKKHFFWKIRGSHLKELVILRPLIFICILL